jgi:hypothetical protein
MRSAAITSVVALEVFPRAFRQTEYKNRALVMSRRYAGSLTTFTRISSIVLLEHCQHMSSESTMFDHLTMPRQTSSVPLKTWPMHICTIARRDCEVPHCDLHGIRLRCGLCNLTGGHCANDHIDCNRHCLARGTMPRS